MKTKTVYDGWQQGWKCKRCGEVGAGPRSVCPNCAAIGSTCAPWCEDLIVRWRYERTVRGIWPFRRIEIEGRRYEECPAQPEPRERVRYGDYVTGYQCLACKWFNKGLPCLPGANGFPWNTCCPKCGSRGDGWYREVSVRRAYREQLRKTCQIPGCSCGPSWDVIMQWLERAPEPESKPESRPESKGKKGAKPSAS